jgi:TerD domain
MSFIGLFCLYTAPILPLVENKEQKHISTVFLFIIVRINTNFSRFSMAINLQKGQKIDIGLSKISVGLGWNPNEGTGHDFDLDASAFMVNASRSN